MRKPSLRPLICHHRIRPVTEPVAKLVHHSPHLEHWGFVAYAGAEVFSLGHGAIFLVAGWLFLTGLLAEIAAHLGESA